MALTKEQRFQAYRAAAGKMYHHEGTIEVDEGAMVSEGGPDGAYVQAWVWVGRDDAGIEEGE